MTLANQVATRTTCMRRGVGAVIVKERRILATGYNGVPAGLAHCAETGCLRQQLGVPSGQRHEICRGLHAEQNAIIQAARYGINIAGASIYINTQPCVVCAKMIINADIEEIDLPKSLSRRASPCRCSKRQESSLGCSSRRTSKGLTSQNTSHTKRLGKAARE